MIKDEVDTTPVDARISKTKDLKNTVCLVMFACFVCALLDFCARNFRAKPEKKLDIYH